MTYIGEHRQVRLLQSPRYVQYTLHVNAEMAESSFRAIFTGEEVLSLLDTEREDGGVDDVFFPGSDEEFGMQEEEIEL